MEDKKIYDVEALRRDFPLLTREVYGKPLVYLDNTATSQTPREVVEAVENMYFTHKANVHRGVFSISQEATGLMEATREKVRAYINADSTREIIFTRGTTEAINLVASSYGSFLENNDEIILTVMEHHADIVPWQLLCSRKRIILRVVPMHPLNEPTAVWIWMPSGRFSTNGRKWWGCAMCRTCWELSTL